MPRGRSRKQDVIRELWREHWDAVRGVLVDPVVTIDEVRRAIERYNRTAPTGRDLSPSNPANFVKDLVRNNASFNLNWPQEIREEGYAARQRTGPHPTSGRSTSFEFIPVADLSFVALPTQDVPEYDVQTVSLPLASRRLGRDDEPWLAQVLVRLHVIETYLALHSSRTRLVRQVDHLQMSVKLRRVEIDALYLAVESNNGNDYEVLVTCEAKGRRDDILISQVIAQVKAAFNLPGVIQDLVLPLAVKVLGTSRLHLVEFGVVERTNASDLRSLSVLNEAIYRLLPPVEGVGGRARSGH